MNDTPKRKNQVVHFRVSCCGWHYADCHQRGLIKLTTDPRKVTCRRCQAGKAWADAMTRKLTEEGRA